jgi:hypothetical protein
MKKLSFLFVAFAIVGFISLNACKSSTKPAKSTETPVEDSVIRAQETADSIAAIVDSTATEVVEE